MRAPLALVIVLSCLAAGARPPAQRQGQPARTPPPPKTGFSALLSAYDAGDDDAVANTLRTPADVQAFMKDLRSLMKAGAKSVVDPSVQDPHRATFWMEVAAAASVHSSGDVSMLLSLGRIPARMDSGARPEAFERLWHQTALALLQRIKRPDLQQTYLDSLELRYLIKLNAITAERPFGRLVLDRAVATEQACWLAQFPVKRELRDGVTTTLMTDTTRLTTVGTPKEASSLPGACREAASRFDRAAAFADVAAEANIRGAVARFKLGLYADGLAALQRPRADGVDAVLDYWGELVEARTLQQVQRLPDAERAYRRAAAIWPDARAPGTGLALVLFDLNRRDEAVAATESVYALPLSAVDPWWAYVTADARFINQWRATLRELAR